MKNNKTVNALSLLAGVATGIVMQVSLWAAPTPALSTGLTGEQVQILTHLSLVQLADGAGGSCKTIRVSEANLQVVNGLGKTQNTDCTGNVIVGYQETGNPFQDIRTGSHNLIVGARHSYTSYGGIIAGEGSTASAELACVTGGLNNAATGELCQVSGGGTNAAGGYACTVSAGTSNLARNSYSSVGGGLGNDCDQIDGAIHGGLNNLLQPLTNTTAGGACIHGGSKGLINDQGEVATICGGSDNHARAAESTVSGACSLVTTTSCEHLP